MITMEEYFKSLKVDLERVYAIWIINNMDLIRVYVKIKYTFLSYLLMVFYCLILFGKYTKIFVQKVKEKWSE